MNAYDMILFFIQNFISILKSYEDYIVYKLISLKNHLYFYLKPDQNLRITNLRGI
jgi:hypothetical protein